MLCLQNAFVGVVRHSEQMAITSLHNINELIFIMQMHCLMCSMKQVFKYYLD
jgi:hypothetical protein